MLKYGGALYSYVHNLQGDIVGICDGNDTLVVVYKYDAWGLQYGGNHLSTIREINPFRYREYIFDSETGMYYLRSRFYCCYMCRFTSTDAYIGTKSNAFCMSIQCYCKNEPISHKDSEGTECQDGCPKGVATSYEIYTLDTTEIVTFAEWLLGDYAYEDPNSPFADALSNTSNNVFGEVLSNIPVVSKCKMGYDLITGVIDPYSGYNKKKIHNLGYQLGLTALACDVSTINEFGITCFFGHWGSEIGIKIKTDSGDKLVGPMSLRDSALREINNTLSSYYGSKHGHPNGCIVLSEFYESYMDN